MKCAARRSLKIQDARKSQKIAIWGPSHNFVQYYGALRPINGWDQFRSLGHPSRFQQVSRLGFITAAMSLAAGQPNFARCLSVFWAGTLYVYLWGLLPRDGILPGAKFTLRLSLAFSYIGSVTAWHSSSGRQPNFAAWPRNGITELLRRTPPIFSWAATTLGIGPHSSFILTLHICYSWPPCVAGCGHICFHPAVSSFFFYYFLT